MYRLILCLILFCFLPQIALSSAVEKVPLGADSQFLLLPANALPMAVIQITLQDTGAISDPKGKAGRADIGAIMLKEGAGELSGTELRRALEDKAIELSVSAERENVTLTLQSLSENLPEAVNLATLILTQPRFEPEALEKIRSQALTQLKQNSQSPGWLANVHFDAEAFGDHPYALPVAGTEASLKALTVQDLKAWHQQFSAQKAVISVAGDVKRDALASQLAALLKALPNQAETRRFAPAPEVPAKAEPIIIRQDIPQTVALFGLPGVKRSDPDFYAAYVMNHILGGGGLISRLSNAIRQQRGLAYYAASYLSPGRYSSVLYGNFATRSDSALEAAQVAREVLRNFAEKGATQAEVQNAIDYLTGSFPLALDKLSSQASYLTSMQLYGLGDDYLDKRNDYFRSVTLEDVNRVAAKLLATEPLVVLVGDPADKTVEKTQ